MRGVVIFSAALMLVPISVGASGESYRYVASAQIEDPFVSGVGAFCENEVDGAPASGGVCHVPVSPGEMLRVSVLDDVNGAIDFQVDQFEASNGIVQEGCAHEIDAHGSVQFVVPDGCSEISIFLGSGGVVGTIEIERL